MQPHYDELNQQAQASDTPPQTKQGRSALQEGAAGALSASHSPQPYHSHLERYRTLGSQVGVCGGGEEVPGGVLGADKVQQCPQRPAQHDEQQRDNESNGGANYLAAARVLRRADLDAQEWSHFGLQLHAVVVWDPDA